MNYDLLLHVDAEDPAVLHLAFNNAANYKAGLPEGTKFRTVMVANGPAVKLFARSNGQLVQRGEELIGQGLDIRVCQNALRTFNLDEDELWDNVSVVPAGVVEIVRLQREGFAYVKP